MDLYLEFLRTVSESHSLIESLDALPLVWRSLSVRSKDRRPLEYQKSSDKLTFYGNVLSLVIIYSEFMF